MEPRTQFASLQSGAVYVVHIPTGLEVTFLTLCWFFIGALKKYSFLSERNNKSLTVSQYIVSNLHCLEAFSLSSDFFVRTMIEGFTHSFFLLKKYLSDTVGANT